MRNCITVERFSPCLSCESDPDCVIRLSSDAEGCHVEDLYKFPDQTGLLDSHGRWREATSLESEVRPGVSSALSISL